MNKNTKALIENYFIHMRINRRSDLKLKLNEIAL
jgi:hypothetical protein